MLRMRHPPVTRTAWLLVIPILFCAVARQLPAQSSRPAHPVIFRLPPVSGPLAYSPPPPPIAPWDLPLQSASLLDPEWSPRLSQLTQPESSDAADRASDAPSDPAPTLGPAPEDFSLQFLREGTVLLSPGQWQFDVGLTYALDDTLLPTVLSNSLLDNTRVRRRTLLVPFAARLGITPSIQAFVNAPVGWGQTELANPEFDASRNVGGIGDVSAGVNVLVEPGSGGAPDIVLTLGMVAPSGNDAFGPSLNDAGLGSGFWSALADLRMIHSYDPVIVFYGAGYRLQFQRKFSGIWVDPGDEITYQLGVGLAINDRVTLSGAVLGSVITETEIDGRGLPGSLLEPVRVRLALTSVTPAKKKIVEPFVIFGVTPDATNVELGVIVTRFGSRKAGSGK